MSEKVTGQNKERILSPAKNDELIDEALIKRIITGDLSAFSEIVKRYQHRVFHFFYKRVSFEDAQDLTQQTFLLVYRNLHRFHAGKLFTPWLFTIARNLFISHLRKTKKHSADYDDPDTIHSQPQKTLDGGDKRVLWDTARRILSEEQFTALWLRYHEELSIHQIAEIIGRTDNHVKVILFRARNNLSSSMFFRRRFPF